MTGWARAAARWMVVSASAMVMLTMPGGPARSADPLSGARADARGHESGAPVPSFEAPLARAPLDPPLVLNGGFGDYRSNHFHAGLDLGTGGRVGRPVYAPLAGWIERVRASGVGYGRSLYLHANDGRLMVFGHLDAFSEPLASFVAAAQESTGQYEQDLWPERGRFRVAAGQRIAWTGESGAGGPHLHFEIRRGDMAYHPLRAGVALADSSAPRLVAATFEPLDDTSYVEGSAAPHTVRLGAERETLRVQGRVRVVVGARDGVWQGVDRMVPWSVSMEFGGERVECRFDSVSWASDMVESDYVYDAGRVVGDKGIVMWAPSGFRPRVLHSSVPSGEDAGTLVVRSGDPVRVLRLSARDLAGRSAVREVAIRPPRRGEAGPDTVGTGGRAERDSTRWFDLASLPENHLRVTYRGAPAGSHGVFIGGYRASRRDGDWTAVLALPQPGRRRSSMPHWTSGRDAAGRMWQRRLTATLRADPTERRENTRERSIDWVLPPEARFESGPVLSRWTSRPTDAPRELEARSVTLEVLPANLRLALPLRIEWGEEAPDDANVGLYADDGDGWSWLSSPVDSALGRRVGETRHLGRFALFADTLAPRIVLRGPTPRGVRGPYSRWALEARVTEQGSGVDARRSRFEVDGQPVPSEWDAEERVLRWRPARPPRAGAHRYQVTVRDRAGNERGASGRFVMR